MLAGLCVPTHVSLHAPNPPATVQMREPSWKRSLPHGFEPRHRLLSFLLTCPTRQRPAAPAPCCPCSLLPLLPATPAPCYPCALLPPPPVPCCPPRSAAPASCCPCSLLPHARPKLHCGFLPLAQSLPWTSWHHHPRLRAPLCMAPHPSRTQPGSRPAPPARNAGPAGCEPKAGRCAQPMRASNWAAACPPPSSGDAI